MMLRFLVSIILLIGLTGVVSAETETAVSSAIPWSGYWWPYNEGGLATGDGYNGSPAPLEKFDLLAAEVQDGSAAEYYLAQYYNPSAENWTGMCDAWSAASITEDYTFNPSSMNNIIINVGDKKGLLTASHDLDYSLGESAAMDSPLTFHTWLQTYIRDEGTAFFADLDPGDEIWNYPIYKYEMTISDFGDEAYVTCQIWYADDFVDPDYIGTSSKTKTYRYTLFSDAKGYYSGEWDSSNHLEKAIFPAQRGCSNPYLDYDIVKQIAESTDDFIESDLPVSIVPGNYNLILANEDEYIINAASSDQINLHFEKIDETELAIQVKITDASQNVAFNSQLETTLDIVLTEGNPPYDISLTRTDYATPGIYSMAFDINKEFSFVRPKAQKGFDWGGYAILNSGDTAVDGIMLSGYSDDGSSIDTFLGPISLAAGEKKIIMSSDFPFRNQLEKEAFKGVKIHAASDAVRVVNLSGVLNQSMALYPEQQGVKKLIIPDTPSYFDYSTTKSWGLYNIEPDTASIAMTLYGQDGEKIDTTQIDYESKAMAHYGVYDSPFDGNASGGWVLAESSTPISGYMEWISRNNDSNEVIQGLIPGQTFYLPNPCQNNTWSTQVLLINTVDSVNPVTLELKDVTGTRAEVTIELSPFQKIDESISSLLPGISETLISSCILCITSTEEIAGLYRYISSAQGDMMVMPLSSQEDENNIHFIPHVASDGYWWTGISLANPGSQDSGVRIIPFDNDGGMMEEYIAQLSLKAGEKVSATIGELFPDVISEVSFVKVLVVTGSPVLGTYGYGSSDLAMLAGAKMN